VGGRLMEKSFEEKIKLLLNSKTDTENKTRIIEELAEFSIEISKGIRGQLNKNKLLEEFADVVIELHMAKEIYNISESELDKAINEKMEKI
jgi:hypothetical protein